MRAKEFLTEAAAPTQIAPDGSKLIAQTGDLWLWQVPASTYDAVYQKRKAERYHPAKPVPAGAGAIYYVSKQVDYGYNDQNKFTKIELPPDKAANTEYYNYRFATKVGDELVNLSGSKSITPGILKRLVKLTGATHAPSIPSDEVKHHVLHAGTVTATKTKYMEYELSPLSDGSRVYKVPQNLSWTVGIRIRPDDPSNEDWDTRWQIESPIAGAFAFVSKGGHIVRLHYPQNKAHAALKAIRELVQREHLTLGVNLPDAPPPPEGKPKVVKPASVMHRMLAYVAEHPGANRSDWFVYHLGYSPAGMAGWTDDKSQDGVAAAMGWIKNEGTGGSYSLSITPVGKLVLARLNSGHPVKHTKQV